MLAIILYLYYLDGHRFKKLIVSILCSVYFGYKLNLHLNLTNCPDCYGNELCHHVQTGRIRFTWFGYVLSTLNPKITKSVFHGIRNDFEWIVLKRKSRRTNKYFSDRHLKTSYLLNETKGPQNLILCPGFRNFKSLYGSLGEGIRKRKLWLDLDTSIEPLLLISLGKLPFPRYIGACGDLIVEEYKGIPLTNFLHSNFETRANLAVKLLKMAHTFTFLSLDFTFYFTDISHYNLVVDSDGNVSLVDLDNVIIFDKRNFLGQIKNSTHTSELFNENEYKFSPTDICSHHLSDHNYFSVCHLLLQSEYGLLRKIPQSVLIKYSDLPLLLNECGDPKAGSNRIYVGQKLQILIEEIINTYKSN